MVKVYEEHGYITFQHENGYEYGIKKTRCDTPRKVCHWVCHLSEKNWVTPDLLRQFIVMALGSDILIG